MISHDVNIIKQKQDQDYDLTKRRQLYGFLIAVLMLILWFVLELLGRSIESDLVGAAGVIGLVGIFLWPPGPPPQGQGHTRNQEQQGIHNFQEVIYAL